MDVIVIGAGAAGLMAANELVCAGKRVLILEARDRVGGRICSVDCDPLGRPIEMGAEFIHGDLEVTQQLLRKAGIGYEETGGEVWQVDGGIWKMENQFINDATELGQKLKELKEDVSMATFMENELNEKKHEKLRRSICSYIEGYYAGDPANTSALSFYREWQTEDEKQYRVTGGYSKLMHYLERSCRVNNPVQLNTVVKNIRWRKGDVEVIDDEERCYEAKKVLITIPLGVWLASHLTKGSFTFSPGLPQKLEAATRMGTGSAIKILLLFKSIFWLDNPYMKQNLTNAGFLLADTIIPTWWTQVPEQIPLLTGWIAGPRAEGLKTADDAAILQYAMESLTFIFPLGVDELRNNLERSYVFNWAGDPFTQGAYSYSTLHSDEARKVLLQPVDDTLFFAGEALYEGTEMGTVEAALVSGKEAARQILKT